VNFSEQPPSTQWLTVGYKGQKIAEVWFKPEGEPFGVTFRIPQSSFQISGLAHLLTTDNLLKTVGLATQEIESWRHEGASHAGMDGSNPELKNPLPPPAADASYLTLHVLLKAPPQAVAPQGNGVPEVPEDKWQELEGRWTAILGMEVSMDMLRISMEGLQGEMDTASRHTLNTEEKLHAFNADVAQWNKAKNRIVYALPKMRDFIHRATWATATPDRKELEEIYKNHIHPRVPLAEIDKVGQQLENLLKDRQVLSAQGVSIYNECKTIAADVQATLRTLQSNAVTNASKKRGAAIPRSKQLKSY
jgi:hypothetical protein